MPNMTNDQRRARVERGRRRMEEGDKQRGKLGILVNGLYVFWNPAHTGYCYCRIEHGVETEIAECIPKTALDPYARVVFVREGPALVAVDPNSLDAVNIYGQAAPALGVPSQPMGNRGSGDWTPTDGNILLANGTQFSSTPLATAFEDWIGYLASGASFALTVASNVLTVGTESSVVVSPQTGTTDDVQQVIVSGFPRLLLLIAAAGCTITLKQFVGGSDNIYVFGGADLAFTDIEVALGWWDGTKLFVTGGGGGSGGGFYQTVQDAGVDQTQRGKLNFIGTTIADNPGNDSTDVTVTGGGSGGITRGVYTQVFRQKLSVDAAEFDTGTIDLSPYEHIKIRLLQARGKHATGGQNIAVALNGDATDANYVGVGYFAGPGFGDFINDGTADSRDIADLSAGTAPADYRGNGEWMIGEPGVSGNGFKSIVPTGQFGPQGAGADYILTYGTMWKNTAAITRIEVIGGAGDIAAGSILEIYGFANESIGGGGGGGTPPTLLLNYTETATIFSNTVLAATTWTDVGVNHTFTVTDAAALIDVTAVIAMQVGGSGSAIDIGLRLVIDSAGTPIIYTLGGGWAAAGAWYEPAGGSIKVSGLSVGAHTVKLQVYATSAAHLFLDPAGLPDTEGMTLQVTQLSGGGGGGSALAVDKKSLTSGDVTVTSTSFVDLDSSLDITLTTGARRCKVSWNLVVTSTGSQSQVDVEIDGARVGGSFGLLAASASGVNANLSGTFLTDVLAAGSHTFKLMVRVDGATSTYRANTTDNPAIFSVEEQANTQVGGAYPKRASMFHDEALILVGNPLIAPTVLTSQVYNFESYQSPPANGDTFTQSFMARAGTYIFNVLGRTALNRGKIDWYLDGSLIVTGQDWYTAGTFNNAVTTTGSIVVATDGLHVLKGVVNGKNGSSSDYYIALTKYWLTQSSD